MERGRGLGGWGWVQALALLRPCLPSHACTAWHLNAFMEESPRGDRIESYPVLGRIQLKTTHPRSRSLLHTCQTSLTSVPAAAPIATIRERQLDATSIGQGLEVQAEISISENPHKCSNHQVAEPVRTKHRGGKAPASACWHASWHRAAHASEQACMLS